ncbi:MAG: phosphocholine cytidylyltransferase family protein [Deltaproteobacteria bacterium]|jgi:choline kinase|nr:phosphocholine cytidylyltransferase family protein [Deltaproteobacteria bacterium]
MKAIILAAGMGTRLGMVTNSLPKCLLKIGDKTVIEMQIEILNQFGINDVAVVIGYKGGMVRSLLKDRATYVVNEAYNHSNSSYSLYLARKGLENGWLHLNCDLLFSHGILGNILSEGNDNSIVVDFDLKPTDDQEKVCIDEDGVIVEMSKTIPYDRAHGKTIGMACFSAGGAKAVLTHLDSVVNSGHRNRWFFSIIADVLDQVPFKAVSTDGEFWAEIDTPEDLAYARKVLGEKG